MADGGGRSVCERTAAWEWGEAWWWQSAPGDICEMGDRWWWWQRAPGADWVGEWRMAKSNTHTRFVNAGQPWAGEWQMVIGETFVSAGRHHDGTWARRRGGGGKVHPGTYATWATDGSDGRARPTLVS
jgi:hypothetical protein